MSDLFTDKSIRPMLIAENVEPFDSPEWIYELKWDGERCIAYLDPKEGTVLHNKRQLVLNAKVPELTRIHRQVSKRCILDGELICLVGGKPNFSAIQRRSLMSDTFRIRLAAQQQPATFVAFDILYAGCTDLTQRSLMERKHNLSRVVQESTRLAVSKFEEGRGKRFFDLAKANALEGIVAKRSDSLYVQGKRTKEWKKIKNLMDDDFVICGFIPKAGAASSIVLAKYCGKQLIGQGHVTLGVGGPAFQVIQSMPRALRPPFGVETDEKAIWVMPTLVCTVAFMERTARGVMRQPVFKGLRLDKRAEDCQMD